MSNLIDLLDRLKDLTNKITSPVYRKWHDAKEEQPKPGRRILIVNDKGTVLSVTSRENGLFAAYWDLYQLKDQRYWAYLEDIIPNINM